MGNVVSSPNAHTSVHAECLQAIHSHSHQSHAFGEILSPKSRRSGGTVGTFLCVVVRQRLTLSQLGSGEGLLGCPEAQLSANHAGCSHVPQVVTHRAPLPLPQHLHATLPEARPRLQAHKRLENKRRKPSKNLTFTFKTDIRQNEVTLRY